MSMKLATSVCTFVLMAAAMPAAATAPAPQPTKPVPANLYTGRWYEIARTPNHMQSDCQASTTDFSGWAAGVFSAVQTCHSGAPSGPKRTVAVQGRVLPASQNAKMQLAMLGGLISKEYWILDRAQDNAWLIMATPDAHYVWLMSRQPVLSAAARQAAMARLQALGFNLGRLAFQQQAVR
jgi:apolipoprotein D and lipocalin family protein